MSWSLIFLLTTTTLVCQNVYGARILAFFPMSAHSHYTLGHTIMKELAVRGHEVYFVNSYPQKENITNFRHITLSKTLERINGMRKGFFEFGQMTLLGQLEYAHDAGLSLAEDVFQDKFIQDILHDKNQTFDLVIMENFLADSLTVFAHRFNCPLVLLAPGPMTIYNNYLFANPSSSAYQPNILTDFVPPFTFWERFQNFLYNAVGELYHRMISVPEQNRIMKKYVKNAPDLEELQYTADLLLIYSHVSFNNPQPLQANIKEIGGYHVKEPKPLPKDLQEYLDEAKEGVIVFSMGSNIRSSDFPEEKVKAVLNSFAKLEQKVLWKFETNMTTPKNVRIMKWLPQSDILAHPNVKMFIGHGGLLSTIESIYHGVPMIGVPVFWDQKLNIKIAAKRGFAFTVPFVDLNEEKFSFALNEVLNNPRYTQNVKQRSKIMRSEPMKQLDTGVFWIEYVMKFNGAPHLRSQGINLKWYQLHNLDVLALMFTVFLSIALIIWYIVKKILGIIITLLTQNSKIKTL